MPKNGKIVPKDFIFIITIRESLRRILVLIIVGVLLVLPLASAEDTGSQNHNSENDLQFTDFPQVYVNVTNNASFNVSFLALLLFTNNGAYFSYFPNERWSIDRLSNNSLIYKADLHFTNIDTTHLAVLEHRFNITNVNTQSIKSEDTSTDTTPILASAVISMNKTYVSDPMNQSTRNSNSTGFQITFSLTSSQITGPGDMLLVQQLGAKINNEFRPYHVLANASRALLNSNDTGVAVNSSSYDAYYWWNSTYLLNGNVTNLTSSQSTSGNVDIVVFKYQFNNGLSSIVQDPYFSIPQVNLFNNPILQKDIQNATQFIVLHIELFIAGIITGGALLGVSYGTYRRKRF